MDTPVPPDATPDPARDKSGPARDEPGPARGSPIPLADRRRLVREPRDETKEKPQITDWASI